jgi:hypothetical protein
VYPHLKPQSTVQIPRYGQDITVNGHSSKILVTDYKFGTKILIYSTAEVLTYSTFDGVETLVLWLPSGESGEFSIDGSKSARITMSDGCSNVAIHSAVSNITVAYTQGDGPSIVELDGGARVVLLDRKSAYLFWSPPINNDPAARPNETGK